MQAPAGAAALVATLGTLATGPAHRDGLLLAGGALREPKLVHVLLFPVVRIVHGRILETLLVMVVVVVVPDVAMVGVVLRREVSFGQPVGFQRLALVRGLLVEDLRLEDFVRRRK